MEVDDDHEDERSRDEVGDVGEVLSVKRLNEGRPLVVPRDEEVEERDDGSLELSSLTGVDGGGGEGLPDYVLTYVGGDEEGDSGPEAVALLEELIEDNNNETSEDELEDNEEGVSGTEGAEVSVHSADDVGDGLADGDEDSEELRRAESRKQREC